MSDERRRFGPPSDEVTPAEDTGSLGETFSWPVMTLPDEPAATPEWAASDEDDEPRVSWFARLLGLKRRERLQGRLRRLDKAVAAAPDAPVNYVLRGELKLKLGQRDEAAADFQQAFGLTERAFAESDWGLVAQALADRALAGLRRSGYALRQDSTV